MGGVLLNMICDDQETTDKVVKCIDKYKLPRITIFTISEIHSSPMDYRIDKNEVSPLKNFIKYEHKYVEILLDSLIRNVLLSKDVDIAEK